MGRNSSFILMGLVMFAAGCQSAPRPRSFYSSPAGVYPESLLYLNSNDFRRTRLEKFLDENPLGTEKEKINYLLSSIRDSGIIFLRNGEAYTGEEAFQWLRWKMHHRQYRNDPIRTADDFVNRVCDRSRKTGIPYEAILPDGERVSVQLVMNHELQTLEKAIRDRFAVRNLPAAR